MQITLNMPTDQIFIDLREDVEMLLAIEVSELDPLLYDREIAQITKLLKMSESLPKTIELQSEKINIEKNLNKRLKQIRDAEKTVADTLTPIASKALTEPPLTVTSLTNMENFNTPEPINSAYLHLNIINRKSVPQFNGDFKEWRYYDMELRRLVLMTDACNQEKFSCLCGSIPVSDQALLSHIDPANPDVNKAYKELSEKYNYLRHRYLWTEIEFVPPVYNEDDVSQWEAIQRKLQVALTMTDNSDQFTRNRCFHIIVQALPMQFRMDIGKKNVRTLNGLWEELLLYIKVMKKCLPMSISNAPTYRRNNLPKKINGAATNRQRCINCSEEHSLAQCPIDPCLMMNVLKRNRLCYLCLDQRFSWEHKQSCRMRCQQCSGFHHTVLHSQFY